MVCPYGKTDCEYEPIYGNYDKKLQCWLYYNDECEEGATMYNSIHRKVKEEDR